MMNYVVVDKVHPYLYYSDLKINQDSLFTSVVYHLALNHREPHCGTTRSCFLRGESEWSCIFAPSSVLVSAEAAVKQRDWPLFLISHVETNS